MRHAQRQLPPLARLTLCALPLVLGACGGGGSSGGGGGATTGSLTFAVTDNASDQLARFEVELTSVQLTRVGGATIGALTTPVDLDLVELQDLSEVLNVMTVAPGAYSHAVVTLDFTNAEVWIVGKSTAATVIDGDGMAVTGSMILPVTLPGSGVVTAAGLNRVLELDFDLDSSVMIDFAGNEITFEPAIVTRVDRADPKPVIVKGGLQLVNLTASTFDLELQRWDGTEIADVVVAVDTSTVYQVNGTSYVGAAGLTALDGLAVDTWVQAYGAPDGTAGRIDATYVEAGTGTFNGGADIVQGHIVGRVGGPGSSPTLTVLGRSSNAARTVFQHNQSFTVNADFTNTNVLRRGSVTAFDTDDLNVGQRVRIFGSLAGTTMNATGSSDVIRMQPTVLSGQANGAPTMSTLSVDLLRVGLRVPGVVIWSEGGLTPPDPDAVIVGTGSLADGLGIVASTPVVVRGFFTGVLDSGDDFEAISVENHETTGATVVLHDRMGGLSVTPTVTTSSISLAIAGSTGTGEISRVDRGFMGTSPLSTMMPLVVQPAGSSGVFTLRDRGAIDMTTYTDFADFATELDTMLGMGASLFNLSSVGPYTTGTQTSDAWVIMAVVD